MRPKFRELPDTEWTPWEEERPFSSAPQPRRIAFRLLLQGVNDGDVRVDFDGLAVENRRAVAPLTDRIERGLHKKWIAIGHLQGLDRAVDGNDGVQFDAAFAADLPGERRIDGINAPDEHGWFQVLLEDALRRSGQHIPGIRGLNPRIDNRNATGAARNAGARSGGDSGRFR